MIFKNHVVLFIFFILGLACQDIQKEYVDDVKSQSQNNDHLFVTSLGDTIDTGAPIMIRGAVNHVASAAEPTQTVLRGSEVMAPASLNVHQLRKPRIVPIPDLITIITPGQDGIPLPKKVSARGNKISFRHPQAIPALAPRIKDEATTNIQYLDVDQGMNSSSVNTILEDNRGHLWLGTNGGGVSRYDGSSFTHYTMETGLSSNAIACILEDHRGNLWFGTKGEGVMCYDGNSLTRYDEEAGLSGTYVESMVEDRDGNIWFGMRRGGGVSQYDGSEFIHYTEREGLISNNVRSLLCDSHGNLWIGTGKEGVSKFDGSSFSQYSTKEGLSGNRVECISEDRFGNIWFGTIGGGASRYDGTSFTHFGVKEGLTGNSVTSIIEDDKGDLWIGTREGGVSHLRSDTFTSYTSEEGLSNNHVACIKQDSKGDLWFGTWGGGVNKLVSNSFSYLGFGEGLNNSILSVMEDRQGNLWIGTKNGVNLYDGTFFTHYSTEEGLGQHPVLSNLPIISMLEDSQGDLWFGTDLAGVSRFDGHSITQYGLREGLSHAAILSMMEDSRGRIWFGTRDGLTRYDQEPNSKDGGFTHFLTQENLWVGSMLEDKMGNLWFGTTAGAIFYNGTNFTFYSQREGLVSNSITSILEDSKGYLWFGTEGSGVSRFDGTIFKNYHIEGGLDHNNVRSILEDKDQNIWISTARSITVLVPFSGASLPSVKSESSDYRFFTLGRSDGLKKVDFAWNSTCLDRKNRMWWGSSAGLIMLDLNQFKFPWEPPEITLTSIEISEIHVDYRGLKDSEYQRSISFGGLLAGTIDSVVPFYNYPVSMNLSYGINHLTFRFSTTDLATPDVVKYSFLLEGMEYDWSPLRAANIADYRNLTPGSYNFKAKASRDGQVWSPPIEYSFSIYPPWWRTYWAYTMYGLLFLSLLWLIRQHERNRQYLRHRLELENIRANELNEVNIIKNRFFANISHEFRAPLTLMLGPVEELIKNHPKSNFDYLQLIRRGSHRLLNLINQLLALAKLDANKVILQASYHDFVPFVRQIFALFTSLAKSRNINYTYHTNTESQFGFFDQELFEKILVNLLSNAIKFSPEGGEVRLDIECSDKVIIIMISDTGPGIPASQLPHLFDRFFQVNQSDTRTKEGTGIGLALVKELVHLHKGTISVESESERGARFTIQMPLGKAHLLEAEMVEAKLNSAQDHVTVFGSSTQSQPSLQTENHTNEDLPLVLIVEDNADMRTYIRHSLGSHFSIAEAVDGRQGLSFAREHLPDFILSDVMMPIMNGLVLCDKLKKDRLTSHIPVVLLTAKADTETRIEGLKCGADAYLAKPFDKQELLVRMQKLIQLRSQLQVRYQSLNPFESTKDAGLEMENDFIRQLRKHIDDNLNTHQLDVLQICRVMRMSRTQVYRKVKALTGKSVGHFIRTIRLCKALHLLKSSQLNISEIAYEVGFKDPAYFSRTFNEQYGMSPSDARSSSILD